MWINSIVFILICVIVLKDELRPSEVDEGEGPGLIFFLLHTYVCEQNLKNVH